jgi:hypothetical protein
MISKPIRELDDSNCAQKSVTAPRFAREFANDAVRWHLFCASLQCSPKMLHECASNHVTIEENLLFARSHRVLDAARYASRRV